MASSPLDDLTALVTPTPGTISYGAPPPLTPEQLARQSGFPISPPRSAMAPRSQLLLPPKTAINPASGTTEIVPGATDLIQNMLRDFVLPQKSNIQYTGGVRG